MAKASKASKSRKTASGSATAKPIDISQQILGRIELTGKPPPLPPINGDLGPRRAFIVGEIDDEGRLRERIVDCCFWTDLRSLPLDDLPEPDGPGYSLWTIETLPEDPACAGENAFLGMLYKAAEGPVILAPPRSEEDRAFDNFVALADCDCDDCNSDEIGDAIDPGGLDDGGIDGGGIGRGDGEPVLISTTNCERSRLVQLSAYVYSGYRTSRTAAINAAVTNAQTYADGVARGRGRRQSCGAGCRSCSSGSANVTITKRDSSVSLIASAFYGEWRYSGYVEFDYSFRVGCCRIGATV